MHGKTRFAKPVACLLLAAGLAPSSFVHAAAAGTTTTTSAPASSELEALRARLTASASVLSEREPVIEKRLEAVAAALKELASDRVSLTASELADRKDKLIAERAALQKEAGYLASAKTAWQAAVDACRSAARSREALAQFQIDLKRGNPEFVSADVVALRAQLTQVKSARGALAQGRSVRSQRLARLAEEMKTADGAAKGLMVAERSALLAESAAAEQKRAAQDAEQRLLEARLAAAGEALGDAVATRPTTTSTAPAPEHQQAEALNKQRLAEEVQAEARDRLGRAQRRLKEIEAKLEQAGAAGRDGLGLERDREYWQCVEAHEKRQLEQAELHQRAARESKEIAQLLEQVESTRAGLEALRETRGKRALERRRERADRFREQAAEARKRADELSRRAAAENAKIQPMQQRLLGLDAVEKALWQRLQQAPEFERMSKHYRRMQQQLHGDRIQADLMITTMQNIVYAIDRRAGLERDLAALFARSAEVLVPPIPSFWERHRKTVSAVKIVALVVGISYGVKLIVWLIQRVVGLVSRRLSSARGRLSAKRVGTLVRFAGSIVKLFVWIFGAITVLNEFGIDYAKSTGAIGLIGLIMAGMFREIVVDFVKGLDIVAGGHYNVGDFVELDGKLGHVVDFSVKHTRIRTLSGQEYSIPNSRCVPSRRFPDGYVNNYVDLTLASAADERRVREVIGPVCSDLNHRIEPMRDTPALAVCFDKPQGQVVVRYRVRVLPGCDWVVTEHFIPAVKEALARAGIELAAEPTFFFMNRLKTFRKLFSRELSEEEIVRQLGKEEAARRIRNAQRGPTTDETAARA